MSRKSKVNEFLAKANIKTSTLEFMGPRRGKKSTHFKGFGYEAVLTNEASTLSECIYGVLALSKNNSSFVVGQLGPAETGKGRYRSVLDIWRHLKYYRDVSIFEVMNALYNMSTSIRGWRCSTIRRRVFWIEEYGNAKGFNHYEEIDELGLTLYEWENIHLEVE